MRGFFAKKKFHCVKNITISAKISKKLDRLIFSCIIDTCGLFSGPESYFYTHR